MSIAFIVLILNAATTDMMYSYLKARIQAHRQYITALHVCVRVQSGAPGCSTASVCVLISLHSSGLSGWWCKLRLSSQVSLLPHGHPISYSQSWEKSGRKIRNHRPTELGSIDCTFLFRSTRWPVPAWLAHWRWPCAMSDECSDGKEHLLWAKSEQLLAHHRQRSWRDIWFL